jgi:flagellar biosynthesis/type III secretory pathway M-ring protein FliF/YscJ
MQVKKEVSPAVVGVILGVVVILVLFFGYRTLATPQKNETKGSEAYMEKIKQGEPMYTPPPGVVPGAPQGGGAGGGMSGGYNLKPPPN